MTSCGNGSGNSRIWHESSKRGWRDYGISREHRVVDSFFTNTNVFRTSEHLLPIDRFPGFQPLLIWKKNRYSRSISCLLIFLPSHSKLTALLFSPMMGWIEGPKPFGCCERKSWKRGKSWQAMGKYSAPIQYIQNNNETMDKVWKNRWYSFSFMFSVISTDISLPFHSRCSILP